MLDSREILRTDTDGLSPRGEFRWERVMGLITPERENRCPQKTPFSLSHTHKKGGDMAAKKKTNTKNDGSRACLCSYIRCSSIFFDLLVPEEGNMQTATTRPLELASSFTSRSVEINGIVTHHDKLLSWLATSR